MGEVGVFICNFNKAEMVIKCVRHIMEQTFRDFDIYVVDNASMDDSVQKLQETYGGEISILVNEENLGGSGGFGRGIREAMSRGYKYFMLVDNDAFMEPDVIGVLHGYLEDHPEVGICGAKTVHLAQPDKLQDLGGRIDCEHYQWGGILGGMQDVQGDVILECDYVASCCLMARGEAVAKFGGFREENFIYWDDIEWCTKCWLAGYKVVVNGRAKALHDMSGASVQNMFLKYYANRNRCAFFARYLPQDKLEDFYLSITKEFYTEIYGCLAKDKYGTVLTLWNAWEDFITGVTGKAAEGRIVPYVAGGEKFAERICGASRILMYLPERDSVSHGVMNSVLPYILRCNPSAQVEAVFVLDEVDLDKYDLIMQPCSHVNQVKENILPRIYVDRWKNTILDEVDYKYFRDFENALSLFQDKYRALFGKCVNGLREL